MMTNEAKSYKKISAMSLAGRKKQMFNTPWSQKTIAQRIATIGLFIGLFLGCSFLAFAISNWVAHQLFTVINPPKHIFTIDLTGQIEGSELGPGDEQTIAPSITNTGTDKMYVFVRINCSDENIFSFTPSSSGWTQVETDQPDEMVYCYGEPTKLSPGESAVLSGTMKVIASNIMFANWFEAGTAEEALNYTVTGCAIGTDAESSDAGTLYNEYLRSGGE